MLAASASPAHSPRPQHARGAAHRAPARGAAQGRCVWQQLRQSRDRERYCRPAVRLLGDIGRYVIATRALGLSVSCAQLLQRWHVGGGRSSTALQEGVAAEGGGGQRAWPATKAKDREPSRSATRQTSSVVAMRRLATFRSRSMQLCETAAAKAKRKPCHAMPGGGPAARRLPVSLHCALVGQLGAGAHVRGARTRAGRESAATRLSRPRLALKLPPRALRARSRARPFSGACPLSGSRDALWGGTAAVAADAIAMSDACPQIMAARASSRREITCGRWCWLLTRAEQSALQPLEHRHA